MMWSKVTVLVCGAKVHAFGTNQRFCMWGGILQFGCMVLVGIGQGGWSESAVFHRGWSLPDWA